MSLLNKIMNKLGYINKHKQISLFEDNHFYQMGDFKPNDVFIVGYPKSGNTWMQQLIAGLLFGIDTQYLPDKLTQELVPQIYVKKYYKRFLPFVCFTSHELPRPDFRKVIYLVRDGRDAMASYYAMNQALGKKASLQEMIIEGKELFKCKWYQHIQAWLENPYNAEILIIQYENLIEKPFEEMIKIKEFLNIERPDTLLQQVINGNKFEVMQQKEQTFGWDNNVFPRDKKFVRKGKIGAYKTEIPIELITYFEQEAHLQLKHFGYL